MPSARCGRRSRSSARSAELNRKNDGTGKPALAARIAIDSGPVVVDAAGEIFGDVPNIAARAQALAEPGSVVVTARVQRQVAGLFVAEERGSHELKGVPEPVTLFRIVRASGGGRRAGQRHLTPLVGRDEEIAMLMRRWERARQGDGQLVLIVGEPGLGKSRLIEEFHARLRETPHTWVEWSCSQLLQNTPLHPIAEWGRQRFGGADVPAEQRLADLENSLAQVKLDPAENAPLLAPLLDIPLPPERAPTLPPEELRRRQLAALTNWVMAGARTQPVVLALEDLHWADPTTLDLLRGIAERGALAPLFVLITARPEFRPPWGMRSHHGTISLAPLDRQQVRRHGWRACRPPRAAEGSGRWRDRAHRRRAAVRRGSDAAPAGARRAGRHPGDPADAAAIVDGAARPARPGARGGADRRRDRTRLLLRAPSRRGRDGRRAAADGAGTARRGRHPAGAGPAAGLRLSLQARAHSGRGLREFAQEPAPGFAPPRRRDIARQVRRTAAAEPELLAHHFTQAGLTEAAIEWWGKAGQRSLERSALVEAAEQFTRALAQIATLPATPALRREQIKLQVALITPLIHVKGYAAPETKAAAERARLLIEQAEALGEPPEDPLLLFSVLYGFWAANFVAFNGDVAPSLRRSS